jgi:hypothetical protein
MYPYVESGTALSLKGMNMNSPESCGGWVTEVTLRATRGREPPRGTDPEGVEQRLNIQVGRPRQGRSSWFDLFPWVAPTATHRSPLGERGISCDQFPWMLLCLRLFK